jgi:Tol biopolymer transport system component
MITGASPIRIACFVGALLAFVAPQETVHDELVRLQRQSGLTLAAYYRGLDTVIFSKRESFQEAELSSVKALEGVVSRDGTEIAFNLWLPNSGSSLGVMHPDGTGLQGIREAAAGYNFCWSFDNSNLAMSLQNLKRGTTPPNDTLQILNLASRAMQEVDVRAIVTQQCWSPDGKQIVYEAEDEVRVFNLAQKTWGVLAKGRNPTWSSDGKWIAFLDDDTYYAINPTGENRKVLFKEKRAMSGLMWSPDSRIVAYASYNRRGEPTEIIDVGMVRIRVRRLADNSEDWVAQESDVHIPRYQWTNFAAVKDK